MIYYKSHLKEYEDLDQKKYLKWKKENVSYRGISKVGYENGGGAMLGSGLYTASLSNKKMAKGYGDLYFVVNAIPKHPKIFKTLNDWEIWHYNTLVTDFCKRNNIELDLRSFNKMTTIESEMLKLGFDGIIISGREIVNFKPKNVLYFKTEDEVKNYYRQTVNA